MSSIQTEPLAQLALALSQAAELNDFVETGTHVGGALRWASRNFRRVTTIELDLVFQRQARGNNAGLENITFVLGDSGVELPKVVAGLPGPALFWLDAHAGGGFFADRDICPLLDEIAAILASPFEHCLIIDDARAFLAPPPPPFDYRKWPSLDEIAAVVLKRGDYAIVTILDVLIVVPKRHRTVVAEFCFTVRPKI
jgi:hypothetical protein